MDNGKAKRIRNAHRTFVEKTMEGATRILLEQTADHVEDSSREKLMGLKFTLTERLSKSWTKQFWKTVRGETLRNKSRIVVSFLQKFTVFWLELT